MNQEATLTPEEVEAAKVALSHCRALRAHLDKAVNELYLFDRVMQLAQHKDLVEIDADRLATLRLRIEGWRKDLAEDLEEVKDLPTILRLGMDDGMDEAWEAFNAFEVGE